jgi:hypothetical protein
MKRFVLLGLSLALFASACSTGRTERVVALQLRENLSGILTTARQTPVSPEVENWALDRESVTTFGVEISTPDYVILVLVDEYESPRDAWTQFPKETPLDIMPCEKIAACEWVTDLGGLREEVVFESDVVKRARAVYYCLGNPFASSSACRVPTVWASLERCNVQVSEFATFDRGTVVERDRVDELDTVHFEAVLQQLLTIELSELLLATCGYDASS